MDAKSKQEYFSKIEGDIAEYGFSTISVVGEGRSFSYTVGLHKSYGHPEMIIFGLPPELAAGVLSDVARRAKDGNPFDLTKPTDELLADCDAVFANVLKENYSDYVLSAMKFNRGEEFSVFQVVWPSASDGLFPWRSDAAPEFVTAQPVLGEIHNISRFDLTFFS